MPMPPSHWMSPLAARAGRRHLNGFEDVFGSVHGDTLVGDGGPNTFYGYLGADVLKGLAGDDRLVGMGGADEANGGQGTDRCRAESVENCEA